MNDQLPSWFIPNKEGEEFWTEERCFITELLNDDSEPEVSVAIARVEVGVTTQLHKLAKIKERYIIRKGSGIVEVDGQTWPVKVGDQVCIHADAKQRITNTSDEDLEFYCICTPRFVPESYVNLENN